MLEYFPFGLPGPRVPFGTQAYEDEWKDELILVDLGGSDLGVVAHFQPFHCLSH